MSSQGAQFCRMGRPQPCANEPQLRRPRETPNTPLPLQRRRTLENWKLRRLNEFGFQNWTDVKMVGRAAVGRVARSGTLRIDRALLATDDRGKVIEPPLIDWVAHERLAVAGLFAASPSSGSSSASSSSTPTSAAGGGGSFSRSARQRWMQSLARLEGHLNAGGSLSVSSEGPGSNRPLFTWIGRQRRAAQAGTIAPWKLAALDEFGFSEWIEDNYGTPIPGRADPRWQQSLARLEKHIDNGGTLKVPRDSTHRSLHTWLDQQRRAFVAGRLEAWKVDQLGRLGFSEWASSQRPSRERARPRR